MAMFSGFPKEDIVLYKLSGEVIRGIRAIVEPKTIFIDDTKINIEEGDFFERSLPNGSTEIYHVVERGFYKGMGSMPDHYQTKVEKTNADAMKMAFENDTQGKRPQKVFISHSSYDKAYVEALVELLEDLGMPDGSIVCTSVPGHGIPGGAKIYDWLRDQFISCDLRVVFALSNNYYNSPASLNEMGAAWVTKATDTLMLLPGFDFSGIKGCVDPTEVGMKLDGDEEELKHRLNEFKDTLIAEHGLSNMTSARWERIRNRFIESVQEIRNATTTEEAKSIDGVEYQPLSTADAPIPSNIPVESALLLVYAACANGQIVRVQTMGTPPLISTAGKEFMKDRSHRESARWQGALDNLVTWRWVKCVGKKGDVFELTDLGYNMADMLKENMDINTDENPQDELQKYGY